MQRSRFTKAQIIETIKQQEAGMQMADMCCKYDLSPTSFHKFKPNTATLDIPDARRYRSLEAETPDC